MMNLTIQASLERYSRAGIFSMGSSNRGEAIAYEKLIGNARLAGFSKNNIHSQINSGRLTAGRLVQ